MHLLMNHKLSGVNEGYITRDKLMSDHLRHAQQALSTYIVAAATKAPKGGPARERIWPQLPARRLGHSLLDPTPPDPRLGVPLGPRKPRPDAGVTIETEAA